MMTHVLAKLIWTTVEFNFLEHCACSLYIKVMNTQLPATASNFTKQSAENNSHYQIPQCSCSRRRTLLATLQHKPRKIRNLSDKHRKGLRLFTETGIEERRRRAHSAWGGCSPWPWVRPWGRSSLSTSPSLWPPRQASSLSPQGWIRRRPRPHRRWSPWRCRIESGPLGRG